jgi:hypothetical protein
MVYIDLLDVQNIILFRSCCYIVLLKFIDFIVANNISLSVLLYLFRSVLLLLDV